MVAADQQHRSTADSDPMTTAPLTSGTPRGDLRAIKWFTLTHALGLLLFAAIMGGFLWYVHYVEVDQQRQALYRDIEWTQQQIRARWRDNRDELARNAADWSRSHDGEPSPFVAVRDFLGRNGDVLYVARLDPERHVKWVLTPPGNRTPPYRQPGQRLQDSAGFAAFTEARERGTPVFSTPYLGEDNELMIDMDVPIPLDGGFDGVVSVGYSLSRLLVQHVSPEVRERYLVSITDQGGNTLVSSSPRTIHDANLSYELPLDPPGHGIRLRAYAFETRPRLIDRTLLLAVVGLSIASLVALSLLWRNARRRLDAEAERDRLFDLSLDLMCVLRGDGSFVRVNPAFVGLFGDAAPGSLSTLAHPDDRGGVKDALVRAMRPDGGAAVTFEARFGRSDRWRWLVWSIRGDPDAPARRMYGVAHDITERKQTETALAAETGYRRAMENSMLTGMRAFDLEGRITHVNRAFCQMLGREAEELIGAVAPYPYWPRAHVERNRAILDRILRHEVPPGGFETTVQRKDGTTFDARMYVSPLNDDGGRQFGWMTSMTDITEPKRIREELAAAHERFTTVLDQLDAVVSVVAEVEGGAPSDPAAISGPLLFANRMYRRLFGADAAGHHGLLAGQALAGDREPWLPSEVFDERLTRWFELRLRRIRWVDGRGAQMLVATDVTRRREAEEAQRNEGERLQQTSRLVTMGEMASSIAHELNQPLTAISNYCMGLTARLRSQRAGGPLMSDDELGLMLGKVAAQADRAGKVIQRIRSFVRRREPERQRFLIGPIVAAAVELAEIDAKRHGVTIVVDLAPDLPTGEADPILIEQVLLNLIRNGLEALAGARRRRLQVTVIRRADSLEFSVADSGTGLSQAALEKLFQPFFTTKKEGMGMGLNICRSIIESHKGRLWVDTNTEAGCTFRFTLPLPGQDEIAQAA